MRGEELIDLWPTGRRDGDNEGIWSGAIELGVDTRGGDERDPLLAELLEGVAYRGGKDADDGRRGLIEGCDRRGQTRGGMDGRGELHASG